MALSRFRTVKFVLGTVAFVIGVVGVVCYVFATMGTAGASTAAPALVSHDDFISPRVLGGSCENGTVVGVLTASKAGAYSLREAYSDGSVSLPIVPATQGKMGDKLALDGPWLAYGESATFLITHAGYDDGAALIVLSEETISRPTLAQCEAAGFNTEVIYGTP